MAAVIELNFFYKIKNIDRYRLSFQNQIQYITEKKTKINIPDKVFRYGRGKNKMKITLFKKNSDLKRDYDFHVYYGINRAYVQLDAFFNISYEIILRSIEMPEISIDNMMFDELDTMDNKDRKRLVLINFYSTFLKINNMNYDLTNITQANCKFASTSYQLSEIDAKSQKFIVKPIEELEECKLNFLIEKKEEYTKFGEDLNDLLYIEKYELYIDELSEMRKKYIDLSNYEFIYFNKLNVFLNEIFEENKDLTLKLFFDFFSCLYFFEYINNFIEMRTVTIYFINEIKLIFEEINDYKEISMSEKVRAINALFLITDKLEKITDLNSLKIKYYINRFFNIDSEENNNKNDGYIMDKVVKFFEQYIEKINENSVVYDNFLFLNGGYGYYKNEKVYTYDMTNLEVLKSHLKDILPQILIFCYMENEEIAFTTPEFGGIVINEYNFLKKYKNELKSLRINYSSPSRQCEKLTLEQVNDIAMDIVLDLIHESLGHKKYLLAGQGILSPKKIIKKKELIELKYIKEYNPNNLNDKNEYVLTSQKDKDKGDSGHFLELCYGKVDNTLITKLLFEMKNKGKLINRADLFTDNGETLKNYVSLRKYIEDKKLIFDFDNNMTIEEEINEMNSVINKYKKNQKIEEKIIISSSKEKNVEEKSSFLAKKRNLEINKEEEDYINKRRKYNLSDTDDIVEDKKEISTNKKDNQFWSIEKLKNTSRQQIIEISKKRIKERFNFKFDESIRHNMIQKLKELDKDDPYYQDLIFLIGEYRIIT